MEPGYIVITKSGKRGRTYHKKGLVNGKLPVYYQKPEKEHEYEATAVLCNLNTIKTIGFID